MGWDLDSDPIWIGDEEISGEKRYLSRDAFINLLYESGLETILGSSVAFIPSEIPEGSKMSIQSIITGIVPINTTWTGDASDGDPQWGFLHPDKDWGFTSKIDFHRSSFQDWIENVASVDYAGTDVTQRQSAVGEMLGVHEDVDEDGVPKPPPIWYEIEENGEIWYVAGNAAEMQLTSTSAYLWNWREFDQLFYSIYLPSLWTTSDSSYAWGYIDAMSAPMGDPAGHAGTADASDPVWATAMHGSMPGGPDSSPGDYGGLPSTGTGFGGAPPLSSTPEYAPGYGGAGASPEGEGLPEGAGAPPTGMGSYSAVSGQRYSGETAIPWSVWEGYLGYETSGWTGPFSQNSFVAYQQHTELINWFDTIIGENTMAAHSHLVHRVNAVEPAFTSKGYDMYNVDENLILNYMEVSKVEPLGNVLGVDRLNPKSTSTIDGDYTEISPPVPTDFANVGVATSPYAIDGLRSRYKITSDTALKMNEWVTAKSLEIEATLYTSIATKLFAVKTQKARPLQHTAAFEGIPTPDSISSTSDAVETFSSRTVKVRTIPTATPTGDY